MSQIVLNFVKQIPEKSETFIKLCFERINNIKRDSDSIILTFDIHKE